MRWSSCSSAEDNCIAFAWVLKVVVLSGLIVLSVWLASLPKKPTSSISALSVPTTALHLQNDSAVTSPDGGNSNTTISYDLEIENPNKDSGIYYDDITVMIFVGDDKIGENIMGAFYQGKGKTKKVQYNVNADPKVMTDHAGEFWMAKAELKFTLVTWIRYKTWGKKSKHHDLNLQGGVPIGSDGKIRGKKKKIKLHHASKKWRSRNKLNY